MHIFQINVSQGGVPKLARPQVLVTPDGVEGDRQRNLDVHGGPERAVCLYSLELIMALQAEGHPIYPGAIGENITLTGFDWGTMELGLRLQLGEVVVLEITHFTTPCTNIRAAFSDERYARVSQTRHPGWSRVYARVLVPGQIKPGDPIKILS